MAPPAPWSLRRRIVLVLVGVVAVSWALSAIQVWRVASRDLAAPSDAIVVLGAAQYRGRPSPVLRARLDHAIGLYARGLAPRLVLTGGIAEGDTASEAAVSRSYVLRAGVPDSAILLENDGRTTAQSIDRVARLLSARRLESVVLVSDPFHLARAGHLARRAGLVVRTSPTHTEDTLGRILRQPGYFLGESLKVPLALVFQW
jgi:uncharacterized SAM-binding protein YcdF (DUF218 family)